MKREGAWCAVIGASEESVRAIRMAQERGYKVVALDGNPEAAGFEAADEAICIDIRSASAVVAALEPFGISFLLPVPMGRWLVTSGCVNDQLGLKGVGGAAVERCVDKYAFHNTLSGQGLRAGECVLLNRENPQPVPTAYPVVVKPRFGSGSRGVSLVEDAEELCGYLVDLPLDEDYLVETAAPGQEYGLDAAVVDNTLYVILLRQKMNTPPPARQCVGYYSVPASEEQLYQRVGAYMRQVVEAVGLNDCLLHADLMVDGSSVYAIEISPRPSGHSLSALFTPACTGIDPVQQFITLQEGGSWTFEPENIQRMLIRFFDFGECTVTRVPTEEQIASLGESVADYVCTIAPGDHLCAVTDGHSVMGRGYVLVRGKSKEELDGVAAKLFSLFERE